MGQQEGRRVVAARDGHLGEALEYIEGRASFEEQQVAVAHAHDATIYRCCRSSTSESWARISTEPADDHL